MMCFVPKTPTLTPVPSLQASKAPVTAAPVDGQDAQARRRAGYMATILASTTGAPAATTAGGKATLGG